MSATNPMRIGGWSSTTSTRMVFPESSPPVLGAVKSGSGLVMILTRAYQMLGNFLHLNLNRSGGESLSPVRGKIQVMRKYSKKTSIGRELMVNVVRKFG